METFSVLLCIWTKTTRNKNCSMKILPLRKKNLTLFRVGFPGASHGWGCKKVPLPNICHTYPAMMKLGSVILYLKKIHKTYRSRDTPWVLLASAIFHWKSATFVIPRNTDIDYILIILSNILVSFKAVLINMVAIFMMSVKLATLSLSKIKLFYNKGHDVIIFTHDVTSKILLHEWSLTIITDALIQML